jgi:O-methyltransferase domain
VLLLNCASLELVVKSGDRYYNSYVSDKILVRGKPKCAIPFVRSGQALQYKGFYHLLDALRQGTNVGLREYERGHLYDGPNPNPELEGVLYEAMAVIWELSHQGIDGIAELKEVRHLLDVAGGNAVAASYLTEKYPQLRVSILDRPSACARAAERIAKNGDQRDIDLIPGDMFSQPFPRGPDGIIFCNILSALSPGDRDSLIDKACAALPKSGKLFLFDFASRDDERGDLYCARLSLYFLVNATGAGMAYPAKDYAKWFEAAGLGDIKVYGGLPFEHAVVVGTKA